MKVRYYIDPDTGQPHIYQHEVTESDVQSILEEPGEDRPGRDGSRLAMGQTTAGRFLRVVYVLDPEPGSVFVVTAFEPGRKTIAAYRRRRKKR